MTNSQYEFMTSEENSSWLVHIGAGSSSIGTLAQTRKAGFKALVFDRNPDAPGAALTSHLKCRGREDHRGMIADAVDATRDQIIAGVLTNSSAPDALRSAAHLRDFFNLAGPRIPQVEIILDRSRWKSLLSSKGIPTPPSLVTNSAAELAHFLESRSSVIIKPLTGGRGSAGVALVHRGHPQLETRFRTALDASDSDLVLAEEEATGREYSVDLFIQDGKAQLLHLGRKHSFRIPSGTLPIGYSWGRTPRDGQHGEHVEWNRITTLAQRVADALSLNDTLLSLDLFASDQYGSESVIDVGLSLDAKVDRGLAFAGLDIDAIPIALAARVKPKIEYDLDQPDHGYATRLWYPATAGVVEQHRSLPYTEGYPLRHQIGWEKRGGERVALPSCVSDLVSWIHVRADDANSAWNIAAGIDQNDHFMIRPE